MTPADLSCRKLVEILTDYLEGAVTAQERIRVEQHLVICSGCAAYADQLRTTVRLTGTLELDELGPESRRSLLAALEPWLARRA
jgi:predicted anti-sigma-YlaC factor YlaD